jgi:uncharacterized membrane protein
MKWTALDLRNLAALFDDMADAVLNFRIQNRNTLTSAQKDRLTKEFGQLVSCGEQLENMALQEALVDIDGAVTDLQTATHDATHALEVISDVQKAITITVAAAALGEAIMKLTPGAVASSFDTLVQAVKQASAKPVDGASGSGSPALT